MKSLKTSLHVVSESPSDEASKNKTERCQGRNKNTILNYNNILTCSTQLVKSFNILKNPLNNINSPNPYYQQVLLGEKVQMNQNNDIVCAEEINKQDFLALRKGSLDDVNEGNQNVTKYDLNYKTWPERCEKTKDTYCEVKNQTDSVNIHINNGFNLDSINPQENKQSRQNSNVSSNRNNAHGCLDMSNNKGCPQGTMRLNQALDSISLAYNPLTKQLHFMSPKLPDRSSITPPESNNLSDSESKKGSFSDEGNFSLSNCDKSDSLSNESPRSTLIRSGHQRGADGGSFSSTISSLSECSLSGSCKDDNKDEAYCAASESQKCIVKADPVKVKKKGLSGFFSRGVFPWRSNGPTNHACKPQPLVTSHSPPLSSPNSASPWKLFGRTEPAEQELPEPSPSTPASSGASTPLRQHRRCGSNASNGDIKQFEDLVASSVALIQHNRPSNLPAKDTAEEQRHRQEYGRMVEAARRREARGARERRRQLAQQVRHEDQLSAALRQWNRTILPAWETTKSSRKTKELWWCGLPPAVRGKVWQLAIPNNLNITPQLYRICVDRAKQRLSEVKVRKNCLRRENREKILNGHSENTKHRKLDSDDHLNVWNQKPFQITNGHCDDNLDTPNLYYDNTAPSDGFNCLDQQDELTARLTDRVKDHSMVRNYSEQNLKKQCMDTSCLKKCSQSDPDLCEFSNERSMELIQLDIARTFPNLCIFQPGGPYFDVLHELLAAYVCYRPDVGYVQGMSFLAAILILNMDAPEAFICFSNLLNGSVLRAAFTLDGSTMQVLWNVYSHLMEVNLPAVHRHFQESALGPELYLLEWLYSVFAKAMPLDVACRVWDVFLRDGDEFLFRTALGVLHLYQDELVRLDFITAAQFLTKLPEDMSSDALFKSINSINMTVDKLTFHQLVDKYKDTSPMALDEEATSSNL